MDVYYLYMSDRINISMPSDFIEKLDEICEYYSLSRSEWVRRKIDEDLIGIKILTER